MLEQLHPENILLHVVNMIILYLLVWLIVYRPVRRFMQERSARIQASLDEAAQAHTQAEQLRSEYEQRISAAENTARERALEITSAANQSAKAMEDSAKQESVLLLQKARAAAEGEHNRALEHLQDEMVELSINIAEQILRREVKRQDSMDLAQSYLQNQTALRLGRQLAQQRPVGTAPAADGPDPVSEPAAPDASVEGGDAP
ncbi:MAG: F0F1 ATP synthase subunit B [Oscillospiraceae bacterium]|jgi:F-type H+-transporting ATPase subunit b|nr:F0F1 ATP synthase subunit B [Oscillospiraceae bacterium]